VPPPWPSGTIICTSLNLHYLRKLSSKYELFWLSGSLGKTFFNDLTKVLHFRDYLPFEEDLALYLNNVEFRLPKDDSYQVWLKLACWFWRKSGGFFSNINCNIRKYSFPYWGPIRPSGDNDVNNSESTLYQKV
jgi:hypothetical protein